MRKLLLVPLLTLLAVPAYAQDAAEEDVWADDPYADTDETVLAVDALMDALLDMPVGRMAGTMSDADIAGDVRPDDTLRSLGTREDPAFEERMRGGARAFVGMASQMLRRLSSMVPEIEAMGDRIGEALPDD